MKTMTCKELGGACDHVFYANTFEEIAKQSKNHAMEMVEKGDKAHLEAMEKMKELMKEPEKMNEWYENKKAEFQGLEDE